MRTTVKTFWIFMLLMLTVSMSCKAIDLTGAIDKLTSVCVCEVSASSSFYSSTTSAWSMDMELGNKPVSEIYSSHQQRLRRILEDDLSLKNILLVLSECENILVHGRTKLYYLNQDLRGSLVGCDYYIYTLRHILI